MIVQIIIFVACLGVRVTNASLLLSGSTLVNSLLKSEAAIHVPMQRKQTAKNNRVPVSSSRIQKLSGKWARNAGFDSANLTNVGDLLYTVEVTIGSGQKVILDLDTGSSDIWARGLDCTSSDGSCGSAGQNSIDTTDPALTSTSLTFSDVYGSGSLSGTVYIGPVNLAGATSHVGIGVSTAETGFSDVDGLLGLAFDSLNSIADGNWWDNLGYTGEQNRFGFYLSVEHDGDSGVFTIGGVDKTKFTGDITWVPLVQETWWAFEFYGQYNVNGIGGALLGEVIADTGTSLIYLDYASVPKIKNAALRINNALGATYQYSVGFSFIDCAQAGIAPNVTLTFGGTDFPIPSSNYIIQYDDTTCVTAFVPGNCDPCILGDVFLQEYYSIYDKDQNRVGFATAVHPGGFGTSGPSNGNGSPSNITGSLGDPNFLKYGGGPVLGHAKIQPIYYGNVRFGAELEKFYNSLVASSYYDLLLEYSTPNTTIKRGTVLSPYIATDLSSFSLTSVNLMDDVATYIFNLSQSGAIKPDANTYYPVHFAPGYALVDQYGRDVCTAYCSFHGAVNVSTVRNIETDIVYYSIIVDQSGCICAPNTELTDFQVLTYISSGELALTVTDPYGQSGWFSSDFGGIQGPCNGGFAGLLDGFGLPGVVDGLDVMTIYSNKLRGCFAGNDLTQHAFFYNYGQRSVELVETDVFQKFDYTVALYDSVYTVYAVLRADFSTTRVGLQISEDDFVTVSDQTMDFITNFGPKNEFQLYALTWHYGYTYNTVPYADLLPQHYFNVYAENSGGRTYDLNNPYFIINHGNSSSPIFEITSQRYGYIDDANDLRFVGVARTLPFDSTVDFNPGTLKLNVSFDDWKTSQAFDCKLLSADSWRFNVSFGGYTDPKLPETVSAKLDYYSSVGFFELAVISDSVLKPKVSVDIPEFNQNQALDGYYRILAGVSSFVTTNFNSRKSLIDGVPATIWYDLYTEINTTSLSVGVEHSLEISQQIEGFNEYISASINFTVTNAVTSTVNDFAAGNGSTCAGVLVGDFIYLSYGSTISKYEVSGNGSILKTIPSNLPQNIIKLDKNGNNSVYALDAAFNFARWNSEILDTTFGFNVLNSVSFTLFGDRVVILNGSALIISDLSGAVKQSVALPVNYIGVDLVKVNGSSIVAVAAYNISNSTDNILLQINTETLTQVSSIPFYSYYETVSLGLAEPYAIVGTASSVLILDFTTGIEVGHWGDVVYDFSAIIPHNTTFYTVATFANRIYDIKLNTVPRILPTGTSTTLTATGINSVYGSGSTTVSAGTATISTTGSSTEGAAGSGSATTTGIYSSLESFGVTSTQNSHSYTGSQATGILISSQSSHKAPLGLIGIFGAIFLFE
ncbi:hypothetical protein HK100_004004 [Physocladia obscura]|uniref:Peptidase A1 domain-containing protein n=1 Tax=Physocladia obscura TaxID=109957 RepID=A0AAD5SVJ9_9FUNG|nr:hypothetical protein HK100_004004 [Physocladia obscura]